MNVDLSLEELRMIRYWRESCHNYNEYCPLVHCMGEAGADFCHKAIQKVDEAIGKEVEERRKQPSV